MNIIDKILPYAEIFVVIIIFSGFFITIFAFIFKPKTFVPAIKPVKKMKMLPIFYFPVYPVYLLIYRSKPESDEDLKNFIKLTRTIFIIIFLLMFLWVFVF